MGSVLEEHQRVEGALAAEHQRERTDEQGSQPQAGEDQHQVAGDREGADGAIEAERRIQQFQIHQAHQTPSGRQVDAGRFLIAEGHRQGGAEQLQHQPEDSRHQHRRPLGFG
jgi:hypothetical protein